MQRHKDKLAKEDKLEPETGGVLTGGDPHFNSSLHLNDVLPEVLQQQTRLDAPDAARRKEYERRIKGEAPPLTAEEIHKYGVRNAYAMGTLGTVVGHVPRMSFGRDRYSIPNAASMQQPLALHRQLSPQAIEAASRTYVAGLRALVYGSLLAAVLVAGVGTYASHTIGSPAEFK